MLLPKDWASGVTERALSTGSETVWCQLMSTVCCNLSKSLVRPCMVESSVLQSTALGVFQKFTSMHTCILSISYDPMLWLNKAATISLVQKVQIVWRWSLNGLGLFCQLKTWRVSEGFSHNCWEANQCHAVSTARQVRGLSLGGWARCLMTWIRWIIQNELFVLLNTNAPACWWLQRAAAEG